MDHNNLKKHSAVIMISKQAQLCMHVNILRYITQLEGHYRYEGVRYQGGESGKVGQSLGEREGIRKELWYVDDQSVYESRLRIRAKGQSHEKQKEFRETGDSGSFTGPGRFNCRL